MSFNAITEAFLADHLGGRVQPVGNDFSGSSLDIRAGLAHMPAVRQAMLDATATGAFVH